MFDEYLAELSDEDRGALSDVIAHVAALVPDATAGRSYGMPAFRYKDKPLLGFVAAKNHLSVFPFSPEAIEAVKAHLDGFSISKGTVRFTAETPLPEAALAGLVRFRIAEIDAH